jgi:sugar-specific transcriptional regulator TrmB
MEPKDLIDAGLTKNQAKVYLKIIRQPAQTGGQIAKGMPIDRSSVYAILASLVSKGLVSQVVSNDAKVFYATNPDSIIKNFHEKNAKLMNIVEELKKIEKSTNVEKTFRFYNGKNSLKLYMQELLDNMTFSSLEGGIYSIFDVLKIEFPRYLNEIREKQIKGRIITSPENITNVKKMYKRTFVKIKTLNGLNKSVCFTLFKDKLAIYSLEENPYVIMINDTSVADSLMTYFNSVWTTLE